MDALKNFVALIGWSPGDDREVMSEDELIEAFSLEGLQTASGQFDLDKLDWLNGHRIRQMTPEALVDALVAYARDPDTHRYWLALKDEDQAVGRPLIDGKEVSRRLTVIAEAADRDMAYLQSAVVEEQKRVKTLADFGEALEFFLVDEPPMDPKAVEKWLKGPLVPELFDWISAKIAEGGEETVEFYDSVIRGFQNLKGLEKLGPVVHPTRVALTGKTFGPGLFELMAVLGHDRIERRLERARALL
jgi:glutamyl-tRNA synthetase